MAFSCGTKGTDLSGIMGIVQWDSVGEINYKPCWRAASVWSRIIAGLPFKTTMPSLMMFPPGSESTAGRHVEADVYDSSQNTLCSHVCSLGNCTSLSCLVGIGCLLRKSEASLRAGCSLEEADSVRRVTTALICTCSALSDGASIKDVLHTLNTVTCRFVTSWPKCLEQQPRMSNRARAFAAICSADVPVSLAVAQSDMGVWLVS